MSQVIFTANLHHAHFSFIWKKNTDKKKTNGSKIYLPMTWIKHILVFSTINMDTMLVPTRLVPMLVENSVILL